MPDRPRVVVHASISVDGAMTGFAPDLAAHYTAASAIAVQARLIGSTTMSTGLDAAVAAPDDPGPRADDPGLPYWVVVDSTGRLHGRLGAVRAFGPVRDVLVLVSRATPDSYLQYLADHRYRFLMTGDSHVDLPLALQRLQAVYGIDAILVDAGPTLLSVLLDAGLVDEVSLLVHPQIVGAAGRHLFETSRAGATLALQHSGTDEAGRLLMRYRVDSGS